MQWRVGCMLLALATPAAAVTLTVTTGADTPGNLCGEHCSLRQAITVANAVPGPDRIALPAGTVSLSIQGTGENANARGDLDVTSDLVITGASAQRTVIDAQRIDRVLHVLNARLELDDLEVRRGRVRGATGGGIAVQNGALTLHRVLVRDCASDDAGGGIAVRGADLLVDASTLAGNRAARGGGLYFQGLTHQLNVESSTISGNVATTGGGLFIDEDCGLATPCAIGSSTIAANRGGGLRSNAGAFALNLGDVLFADNEGGSCAPGSGRSIGHNLDDDGTCPLTRPNDHPAGIAALAPLADTGGPTPTHALGAGSAAVDAGDPDACPPLDQRGQARVGTCDIGAHEATAGPCGDGIVDRGEVCDGDPCCDDACDPVPDGDDCAEDGDPCTADRCVAGQCRHEPAPGLACQGAGGNALLLSAAGALDWQWRRGAATDATAFGVPAGTSALCVFDAGGSAVLTSRVFPAGPLQWRAAGEDGFQSTDGAARVLLHGGRADRSRIAVQIGALLPVDVTPPVRIEWRSPAGTCWASDFAAADLTRDDDERLVGRRRR